MPQAPVILRNAAGGDVPELWFYTEFGPDWAGFISANLVRQALNDIGPTKKLNIHFNCEGGDIIEALTIYNLLKNCGAKITCFIDGLAASCASWVAQVGDTIVMMENTLMMIHNPEGGFYGDEDDFRRQADVLAQTKTLIVGMYAARANATTPEQFAAAMKAETWYTASEALAAGLIDEIDPNKSKMVNVGRWRNSARLPDWVAAISASPDNWKRAMNERRQLLNELNLSL